MRVSRTVESGAVFSEFVNDFVHFECREDGLDERGRANGSAGNVESLLREHEDVVPESRLLVALHLRQVEVRAAAALQQLHKQNHTQVHTGAQEKRNERGTRKTRVTEMEKARRAAVAALTFFALWKK